MLGGVAVAVPALSSALETETDPRVREAIMTALIRTGDEASVRALLPSVRSQDASRRGSAIEALQALPEIIDPFLTALLADDDSDVRLLATELTRNMPAGKATEILCKLLERELHPNVCAAAVEVLAELGTQDAMPVLTACAERFRDSPFMQFAIATTMGRISGTGAS
jgi:HEAT repeat protein